ncbi:hypothetical protein [Paenibacillus thalictri]|uniref:Uncharacterized protein n=1 Tax=Paenibacillus thalictri TaxID=2527873 RepID=A0A4Q9DIV9_9BACL|nr:hypothetical protein [Paenibacillus thalictri]TBL72665.1 hypothetical protein EYB31_28355 [Paenibacillus thalictri]
MGVRYAREYSDIIADLSEALSSVRGCYELLDMGREDWEAMELTERSECLRTLADDVFYGLGSGGAIRHSGSAIRHDRNRHIIVVSSGTNVVTVVFLI